MPKMVCADCQTELKIETSGIYVFEMFCEPPKVYKIWCADEWKCHGCGKTVIAGFGSGAIAEHFEEEFETVKENILAGEKAGKIKVFYDYEKPNKKGAT
jgi:hypothetical protein